MLIANSISFLETCTLTNSSHWELIALKFFGLLSSSMYCSKGNGIILPTVGRPASQPQWFQTFGKFYDVLPFLALASCLCVRAGVSTQPLASGDQQTSFVYSSSPQSATNPGWLEQTLSGGVDITEGNSRTNRDPLPIQSLAASLDTS